uniref:Uncharacterized protein n=1 Tax=Kalanchoe fedtschenkoi TaxID=63787 RepID=A0A7N0ZVG8_KALFE
MERSPSRSDDHSHCNSSSGSKTTASASSGGLKKGPWTPEEDIILVSYVQQHGASNWRAVPANAGLLRCSKSCRLRWTNYLRPGIKRGNFTDQEQKMIIHLQALLGNRWAAIASYLPQRTENDIKNYWNTNLRKKAIKNQLGHCGLGEDHEGGSSLLSYSVDQSAATKGQWERRLQTDINLAKQALSRALAVDDTDLELASSDQTRHQLMAGTSNSFIDSVTPSPTISTTYASSTANISKLLDGWMKKKEPAVPSAATSSYAATQFNGVNQFGNITCASSSREYYDQFDEYMETKPYVDSQVPLLEKWLMFDDGGNNAAASSAPGGTSQDQLAAHELMSTDVTTFDQQNIIDSMFF